MAGRRVLIVGGVAGGASCAARLRRLDEDADIVMFERGPYISFANCGLPYYIGGVIEKRSKLLVQTPERFQRRFRVETRTETEVTRIDRENREVEFRGPDGVASREPYDYLVLAPGAEPIKPPLPGVDLPGIFTLRNVPDTDRIVDYVEKNAPHKAVIVGGGYIGLEMAENLHHRGVEVAVVEMLPQVMSVMDPEMAQILHEHLHYNEIATWLGDAVSRFDRENGRLSVTLESGDRLPADMVILAVGVKPDVRLARDAGLKTGETGGIKVDEHMRTSDERIFAVGDAVEVTDLVTGKPALIPLAGPAVRQGRIAADNICGRDSTYKGTQGTAIVKVFELAAATTGANERTLKREGIPYDAIHIHPASHAGYYPHSFQMAVKALFRSDDGRLLGVQIIGPSGVDKRIDVLATALRAGMTVFDLEDLELAYAPPYGAAKDPVNMVGFVASNVLKGDMKARRWDEIDLPGEANEVLVDVRTRREWDRGHVEGAVNIPVDEIRERLDELPKDKAVIAYCAVGFRAYLACRILTQKGFDCSNMSGGWRTFRTVYPEKAAGADPRDMFAQLQEKFCNIPTGEPRAD